MNYYAKTDIGKVRNKNQDQAAVNANIKDQVIAVVCDGMGGHRSGEIASRVVMDHVLSCFDIIPPFDRPEELKKWLQETIVECDQIVKRMAMPVSSPRYRAERLLISRNTFASSVVPVKS